MKITFRKPVVESVEEKPVTKYDVEPNGVVNNVRQSDTTETQETPKNKGGRPKGSKNRPKEQPLDVPIPLDGVEHPTDELNDVVPTVGKNKGGRPKGSGKGQQTKQTKKFDTEAFAQQFVGLHKMIGLIIPGVDMSLENARGVAVQWENVKNEFGIEMSGKVTALLGFAGAIAIAEAGNFKPIKDRIIVNKPKTLSQVQTKKQGVEVGQPFKESPQPQPPQVEYQLVGLQTNNIAEGEPYRG